MIQSMIRDRRILGLVAPFFLILSANGFTRVVAGGHASAVYPYTTHQQLLQYITVNGGGSTISEQAEYSNSSGPHHFSINQTMASPGDFVHTSAPHDVDDDVPRVTGSVLGHDPKRPLKVLFLSSDTGGGHRASAEALAKQFQLHYPGSTYDVVDVWTLDGVLPYRTLVSSYKHLSANPSQWRLFYHLSNTAPNEFLSNLHSSFMCESKIRRRIASYDPDVVVSVHPTMNRTPIISTKRISRAVGKHIPFFTVVTDLGSGHSMWFQRNVERLYVASERIRRLARRRGRTPADRIVMTGLPIRHEFAVQADRIGSRTSPEGEAYQRNMKSKLGIDPERPMVLVMGGGEGVGSLSTIVNELYSKFTDQGIDATICVVCGRNEKLRAELGVRDWDEVLMGVRQQEEKRSRRGFVKSARSDEIQAALDRHDSLAVAATPGKVDVVGLGFVSNMADYMVAATVLVTKAGPGTIAEAAAVGLPIMLTSFLPGQEAGNVRVVLDAGCGDFNRVPSEIAREVSCWFKDGDALVAMSRNTERIGHPNAASDIVQDIGDLTQTWMELNGERKSTIQLYRAP